jgi:mono/diheme cytochrome c family protein
MKARYLVAALLSAAAISDAVIAEAQDAQKGKSLYGQHCLRCHGRNMVTPGTVAYDLRTFPEDAKPRFAESITKGKKNMPPWGDKLSAEQIDDLWAYVLTRGK